MIYKYINIPNTTLPTRYDHNTDIIYQYFKVLSPLSLISLYILIVPQSPELNVTSYYLFFPRYSSS